MAVVLLGLLVLVAIGARAGHPFGHARLQQREVPARVGNDLFTLVVILFGIAVAVVLAAFFALRKEEWRPVRSHWIRNLLVSMVILSAVSFLGYEIARVAHHRGAHTPAQQGRGSGRARPLTLPNRPAPRTPAHFDWEFAAALAGLVLLGAAYLALRMRRETEAPSEPERRELEEVLERTVRETIDDLRGATDPRRAVIAAYARMEGVLARYGFGRRPAETPYEYLERVLAELNVAPEAVRELTDLFELAKFSSHAIGDELRDRAVLAFVAVRDDLRAVPAT